MTKDKEQPAPVAKPHEQEPVGCEGAIVNGRVYADRLEHDYKFECEAGPLHLCTDWVEFRRCFEWLAQHTSPPAQQPAQQEFALKEIEQYRLQMAGISTAAIGYWKEGDGIHPDYDTVALRDVAKLYAKYDELYREQPAQQDPVAHGIIAGALFDFMGWLTTRPKRIMLSSADDASPAADAIKDFAKMRGLSLDDAKVQDWSESRPAQRTWVGLTDEEVDDLSREMVKGEKSVNWLSYSIEAKLKELNT